MSSIHHPTGTTIEIVGIEAKRNGQSCLQLDICGEVIEEDVVLRLQKVQILNSQGKEETAIAAYHKIYPMTPVTTSKYEEITTLDNNFPPATSKYFKLSQDTIKGLKEKLSSNSNTYVKIPLHT
jgi:hypothetical protein